MSDAIPEGMKRVERPDLSTIRGRLQSWIDNPAEGEGLYIDTLEPLVQEMLAEQREMCWHKSQYFLSQAGAWDCMQGVRDACLNAVEKSDE